MPYIKGENRNQLTLFPESIDDYITEDNVVRVIDAYVDQIDVVAYKFTFAHCPNIGRPPYSPQVMLKLYIYGYLNRIRSSRRLEHEAKRNVELMWLLGKLAPDFKTIADFRKNNKKSLVKIFKDFTRLCRDWDLFGKELVAVDGSKFKASHPFGTIKQSWDAGHFLTRGVPSVSAETALSYLAYNLKRVINIMGVEEMVKRLKERGNPVLV